MLEVSSDREPWAALIVMIRIVVWVIQVDSFNDLAVRPIPAAFGI
jgi:hypothetical protein